MKTIVHLIFAWLAVTSVNWDIINFSDYLYSISSLSHCWNEGTKQKAEKKKKQENNVSDGLKENVNFNVSKWR